jgi:chitinase
MGKKKKKSFYKKQLKPFVKSNKVLIAALGGAAAGITISNILGSEKAQHI